jgi:hypothetical protein
MRELDPEFVRTRPWLALRSTRRKDDEPVKYADETWEAWHRKMAKYDRRRKLSIQTYIGAWPNEEICGLCYWDRGVVVSVFLETTYGKVNIDLCRKCAETLVSGIDGILTNPHLRVNKGSRRGNARD